MTYDEYKEKITGLISDPDSAPVAVTDILSSIEADLNSLDSATKGIAERDERIASLQATNVDLMGKILMEQGSDAESVADPEDWSELEGNEALEAFIEAHKED